MPADREKVASWPAWGSLFWELWSKPQKRAIAAILEDLRKLLPPEVPAPSYSQVRRFIGRTSKLDRERGRRGPNAIKERRGFVRRDTSKMRPTDVYVSDGHTFDAEIAHPSHGRPFRPELTCVIDWKTRRLVGWSAALSENTYAVADALRHALTRGVPASYYADRGAGQDSKEMGEILARCGIERERSLPRNSQARGVIERFNQHLVDAAKRLPLYMGRDMDPDAKRLAFNQSRRELREVGASRLLMPWKEFVAYIAATIDAYNARPHRGLPKITDSQTGRRRYMSPDEAWQAAVDSDGWTPVLLDFDEMADLFMPRQTRKVIRCEVSLFRHRYFEPPAPSSISRARRSWSVTTSATRPVCGCATFKNA